MNRSPRYLFVCSGNICRSPMAEVVARGLLEEAGVRAEVSSAGTLGIEGHPASDLATRVVAEIGYDLESHRSRGVTRELLGASDTIFVMAPEHEFEIAGLDGSVESKIERLWEYCDPPGRLTYMFDPVGCGIEVFRMSRDDILECLKNWIAQRHGGT